MKIPWVSWSATEQIAHSTERFRPKKFHSELIEQVRPSIGKTAEALGVAKSTVWLWSKRIPEFRAVLDEQRLRASRDRTVGRLEELEGRMLRNPDKV